MTDEKDASSDHDTTGHPDEKAEPQISPNKPGDDPREDIEDTPSRVPRNPGS